ncbi:hypothetical protein AXK57_21870 [Tsukamurella pulmonis]|uniref:hypothetical protein n=1 Tax=Tsukamurella pulmonis TaxID=47312 RepID=UPI000795EBD8|nr:hypothetical protein [Tsukamurella pulmonis]KXP11591.1 hypothetical protein AXK57_21870 [Tsukamurella pulmonis]
MTYDPQNQPTRAYSANEGTYPYAASRGYEPQPEPEWGAPPKPQPMNVQKFALSAFFIAILAGFVAWGGALAANKLPAPASGGGVYHDPLSVGIGTGILTVVAAAVLVGLIYNGAKPGSTFLCLAVGLVVVFLLGAWGTDLLTSWQAWVSTGLFYSALILVTASVLYGLGRSQINKNLVTEY